MEYGFPVTDDCALFERLALEINQAGLSWLTVLKKRRAFQSAFDAFDIDRVASYGDAEKFRLLADSGIVRNRLKIDAVIDNARRIQELQREFGSFVKWLDLQHPMPLDSWVRLFKQTFRFTGGEIVREFLVSTGYLPGAHTPDCPIYAEVMRRHPPWTRSAR